MSVEIKIEGMIVYRIVIAVRNRNLCCHIEKLLMDAGCGISNVRVDADGDVERFVGNVRGALPNLVILDSPLDYPEELQDIPALLITDRADVHFKGSVPTGILTEEMIGKELLHEARRVMDLNFSRLERERFHFICSCDRFERMLQEDDRTPESLDEVRRTYLEFLEKEDYTAGLTEHRVFYRDGRFGLVNMLGHVVHEALYEEISPDGIARKDGRWGVVDVNVPGEVLYPFEYDAIGMAGFSGYMKLERDGKCRLADSCRFPVSEVYDDLYPVGNHGEVVLVRDGKKGLYAYGRTVPAVYDEITVPALAGWVRVCLEGKWGYIDRKGEFTRDVNEADLHLLDADTCWLS